MQSHAPGHGVQVSKFESACTQLRGFTGVRVCSGVDQCSSCTRSDLITSRACPTTCVQGWSAALQHLHELQLRSLAEPVCDTGLISKAVHGTGLALP
jgi:hypothetical protein